MKKKLYNIIQEQQQHPFKKKTEKNNKIFKWLRFLSFI